MFQNFETSRIINNESKLFINMCMTQVYFSYVNVYLSLFYRGTIQVFAKTNCKEKLLD